MPSCWFQPHGPHRCSWLRFSASHFPPTIFSWWSGTNVPYSAILSIPCDSLRQVLTTGRLIFFYRPKHRVLMIYSLGAICRFMLQEPTFIWGNFGVILWEVPVLGVDSAGRNIGCKAIRSYAVVVKEVPRRGTGLWILARGTQWPRRGWSSRFGSGAWGADCITVTLFELLILNEGCYIIWFWTFWKGFFKEKVGGR